jgi:hypothetical protein
MAHAIYLPEDIQAIPRPAALGGTNRQQIRPSVDRRFEHQLVAGIPQLQPPEKMDFYGRDSPSESY